MFPLNVGKWFLINDLEFRFVDGRGKRKREAYDLEVVYRGQTFPCEAKAKIEASVMYTDGLTARLRKAATQLPEDRPSLIAIGIPSGWTEDLKMSWKPVFDEAVEQLFQSFGTTHVSAVFAQGFLRGPGYRSTLRWGTRPVLNHRADAPLESLSEMFSFRDTTPVTPKNDRWPTIGELLGMF